LVRFDEGGKEIQLQKEGAQGRGRGTARARLVKEEVNRFFIAGEGRDTGKGLIVRLSACEKEKGDGAHYTIKEVEGKMSHILIPFGEGGIPIILGKSRSCSMGGGKRKH